MANLTTRSNERSALPARWDPVREVQEVQERMDRLFSDGLGGSGPQAPVVWAPADLEESDDAWVVEADLPGYVDVDRVEAKLDDGVLTVRIPKPARAQARRIEVKGS